MCLICERKFWFLIKPLQFSDCLIGMTKPKNDKLYCLIFVMNYVTYKFFDSSTILLEENSCFTKQYHFLAFIGTKTP